MSLNPIHINSTRTRTYLVQQCLILLQVRARLPFTSNKNQIDSDFFLFLSPGHCLDLGNIGRSPECFSFTGLWTENSFGDGRDWVNGGQNQGGPGQKGSVEGQETRAVKTSTSPLRLWHCLHLVPYSNSCICYPSKVYILCAIEEIASLCALCNPELTVCLSHSRDSPFDSLSLQSHNPPALSIEANDIIF